MSSNIGKDILIPRVQNSINSQDSIKKYDSNFNIGELRRQTIGNKIIISLKSSDSFPAFLLFVVYLIASGLTYLINKERSGMYKAEAMYNVYDLTHIFTKAYFDPNHQIKNSKSMIVKSMNICKREVLENNKDYIAAEQLKIICSTMDFTNLRMQKINLLKDIPDKKICDGICFGIQLDIAKKYLIDRKSVEEIVEDNENGASCEAAANQAVYSFLKNSPWTPAEKVLFFLDQMKESSKIEGANGFFHLNFDDIIIAFNIINTRFYNVQNPQENLIKKLKDPFLLIVQEFVKGQSDEMFNKEFFSGEEIEFFEKGIQKCINKNYEKDLIGELASIKKDINIKKLKWLKGLLELRQAYIQTPNKMESSISDPLIRESWMRIRRGVINLDRMEVIAKARELKFSSVADIMGKSFMYGRDSFFLKNLSKLPEGIFGLCFSTLDPFGSGGGHAITYIKEKDGVEYILDPNGIQLVCKGPEDSIFHIQKLLTFYSEPKNQDTLYTIGYPNHQLSINRIEKRDPFKTEK